MHSLKANSLEMLTDVASVTIAAITWKIVYGLTISIFAFDPDPFHGWRSRSCTISTAVILETVTEQALQLPSNRKSGIEFQLLYLGLPLALSKGRGLCTWRFEWDLALYERQIAHKIIIMSS